MPNISLESIYGETARRLRESLLAINPMTFDGAKAERIRTTTRRQVALLNLATKQWADIEIPKSYRTGARRARVALEILGKKQRRPDMEAPELRLRDRMLERAFTANNSIRETVDKFLGAAMLAARTVKAAQVQEQINMDEAREAFERWGMEAVAKQQARGVLSKKIYEYLRALIDESNFIEINGRNYNMRKYSKMVARTELREAQSEATKEVCRQFEHDLVEISEHGTECEICIPYEGQVYSLSGNHPDYPMLDEEPPFHPNCSLPGTRCVSPGGIISGLRARYNGQAIHFVFSKSGGLSVSVNHIFLTPKGFVPAHLLNKGDDIFYCPDFERIIFTDPNRNRKPTIIEEIIGSLAETSGMSSRAMPVSPEDIHGDGRFCYGNIDIINPDGLLRNTRNFAIQQNLHEFCFGNSDIGLFDFSGSSDFTSMFKRLAFAADGGMRGSRYSASFFGAKPGSHYFSDFTSRPDGNFRFKQAVSNNRPMNVELLSDIAHQGPGLIHTQKIVDIQIDSFHGDVFDLQTATSLYLSNGVLSSNCLHVMRPVSEIALEMR